MPDSELLQKLLAGDPRSIARAITKIESGADGAAELMKAVFPNTGRATVIGITGSPGAGKSSLVDKLALHYKNSGDKVGIICVDPSSPFSGGALLGDRVRMQRHALDDGVFIRSLATRGQQGGLSRSTTAAVAVLDAAGFPLVFVETVGAGQAEIDVADAADAVIVVTVPGLGDEVQALKAGLLEIADVLVVNKGDRDGADRAMADLTTMLGLAAHPSRPGEPPRTAPALLRASATTGAGVADIVAALDARRGAPAAERAARRRRQAVRQITALVGEQARAAASAAIGTEGSPGPLASTVDQVAARTLDPWSAAEALATASR